MNRVLDLRTGRPVWMAYRAPSVPFARLQRDVRADVLVIGMGVSGAMIVEALTAEGFKVTAIDRRGPLLGSTPASSALVLHEIDLPLTELSHRVGCEKAERAWRRSCLAVANLSTRIDELGIPCSKRTQHSLLLAGNRLGAGGLREEAAARRAAGLYAEYLPRGALLARFGLERGGAILSPGSFALDPRRLTAGLLLRGKESGARYYAPVEATHLDETGTEVVVRTADGPSISAPQVVLATGYEQMNVVPPGGHSIASTWVIATARQPRRLSKGQPVIWEASDPYLYVGTTADGRVVCGGEDEEFSDEEARDALIPKKSERLARKLAKLLPGIDSRPQFAWAGSFGTTATALPRIGRLPGYARVHAVMGYGGNGFTFSRIAAEIVRADLTGAEDADRAVFAFDE